MSIAYTIEVGFVWYKLSGHQEIEETKQAFEAALRDPGFREGLNVLIDARDSSGKRTSSDLSSLANFFGSHRRLLGKKFALLIQEQNPTPGKYSRTLVPQSDRYKVRFFIFYAPEDAIKWLTTEIEPS
ncbi:hypothetical protein AUK22_11465 [bacterium CG2_30_54_10]|nr:MAG: hypothetical protein AUK22_11465 [bacterium CG2_30_54_10]